MPARMLVKDEVRVIKMYLGGVSTKVIASRMGRSVCGIYGVLHRHGVRVEDKLSLTKEQVQAAFDAGGSWNAAARILGVAKASLWATARRRFGLIPNPGKIDTRSMAQLCADFDLARAEDLAPMRKELGTWRAVAGRLGVTRNRLRELRRHLKMSIPKAGGYFKLPPDERKRAVELYESGLSLRQVGAEFGVSQQCIEDCLAERGIKLRTRWEAAQLIRKWHVGRPHYFDEINTPEKAYWLGFIAADFCVTNEGQDGVPKSLKVNLAGKDRDHLVKFALAIDTDYPITRRKDGEACLDISDRALIHGLMSHGIGPRKSLTLMPLTGVPDELMRDLIRGYVDGDGTVCCKKAPAVGMCGTREWLVWVQEHISRLTGKNGRRGIWGSHAPDGKMWKLNYGGRGGAEAAGRLLYEDATVYMDRKRNNYLTIKARNDRLGRLKLRSRGALDVPERDEIIARYHAGELTRDIAAEFGLCGPTIRRVLKEAGVKLDPKRGRKDRPHALSDENEQRMAKLYAEGWGQIALSKEFGVSQPGVSKTLHRMGVKTRRAGVAAKRPVTSKDIQAVRGLYESGLTQLEIADKTGIAQPKVSEVLRQLNVEIDHSRRLVKRKGR